MGEKEFRQKVLPLQRMMYALALKIGLPPDDAADAVQETMLKLWRGREGIPEEPRQLHAWGPVTNDFPRVWLESTILGWCTHEDSLAGLPGQAGYTL